MDGGAHEIVSLRPRLQSFDRKASLNASLYCSRVHDMCTSSKVPLARASAATLAVRSTSGSGVLRSGTYSSRRVQHSLHTSRRFLFGCPHFGHSQDLAMLPPLQGLENQNILYFNFQGQTNLQEKTPLFLRSLFFIFEKYFYIQLFFKQTTPLFGKTSTIIIEKRFQFFPRVLYV